MACVCMMSAFFLSKSYVITFGGVFFGKHNFATRFLTYQCVDRRRLDNKYFQVTINTTIEPFLLKKRRLHCIALICIYALISF